MQIRENKTYCEVVTPAYLNNLKDSENIIGVILSGGPNSTINDNKHDLNDYLFELDVPVLGICFGMQLICKKFGGVLEQSTSREYGKAKLEIAVAKGKKQFDKRLTKKTRDWNREKARYIRKSS